jgi:hypothetical protein
VVVIRQHKFSGVPLGWSSDLIESVIHEKAKGRGRRIQGYVSLSGGAFGPLRRCLFEVIPTKFNLEFSCTGREGVVRNWRV